MSECSEEPVRRPWAKGGRGAALGFGLGAGLALSPFVWAQDAPATAPVPQQNAPVLPQQSFAPLVKKVLPAVVNISVTEKSDIEGLAERMPEAFRGSPFDDFLKRFFEQHNGEGQLIPRPFRGSPGEEGGAKRIALGSGFIVDRSGYIVTNNHVVGE